MSINPGLERITLLLSHFPPLATPVIHIAGTNGKGSVSAILDSVLVSSGYKTGRFNSPHLISVEDSIRINGLPVPRATYDTVKEEVERVDGENDIGASLFEVLTVTALQIFERGGRPTARSGSDDKLDVLLVECGMGGVKDATNVFPSHLVLASVLTSVDLDHQAFLGNTVEEITMNKAGIVKEGGVLVVGRQKWAKEVEGVVGQLEVEKKAEIVWAEESLEGTSEDGVDLSTQVVITPLPNLSSRPGSSISPSETTSSQTLLDSQLNLLADSSLPNKASRLEALRTVASTYSQAPRSILLTQLPLPGQHQRDNLSLALSVLHTIRYHPVPHSIMPSLQNRLTDSAIEQGVRNTQWEGRCSWVSLNPILGDSSSSQILVDGAHNAASASLLRSYIDSLPSTNGPTTYLLSLSHSPPKTPLETLSPLLAPGDRVAVLEFTTPIEGMPWVQPVPKEVLVKMGRELVGSTGEVWVGDRNGKSGLEDGLKWAFSDEKRKEGLVVLCGSLYFVADLFRLVRGL